MANIRFRLAKPSDAKQIAYVHLHIEINMTKGFCAGKLFFPVSNIIR